MDQLPTFEEFIAGVEGSDSAMVTGYMSDLKRGLLWPELKDKPISKEFVTEIAFIVSRNFIEDMHEYGLAYSKETQAKLKNSTTNFLKSLLNKAVEAGIEIHPALIKDPINLNSWVEAGEVKLGGQ